MTARLIVTLQIDFDFAIQKRLGLLPKQASHAFSVP